ncbi:MAG TPA: hypothetical protein PKN48_14100 [Bacteroidales bacterium]|nr:hypothetical protein [Bacteroidales bacterium]
MLIVLLKKNKKRFNIILFGAFLLLFGNLNVVAQNIGCFSVLSMTRYVSVDPGQSVYTALSDGSLDVIIGTSASCKAEKTAWSFTYVLDGATRGSGSTTLNGVKFNKGKTSVIWTVTNKDSGTVHELTKFYVQVEDK